MAIYGNPLFINDGGMSKWELLWTNASPDSAFSPQTISLDLSGYDAVLIVNHRGTQVYYDAGQYTSGILLKGYTGNIGCYLYAFMYRAVTVSSTGCTFGTGKYGGTMNAPPGDDNTAAVPVFIYGIKGVG